MRRLEQIKKIIHGPHVCFLSSWFVWYLYRTVVVSYRYGNAKLLSAPRDYQGNACGVSGELNSRGVDLGNYSYVGYTVNMTALSKYFPSSNTYFAGDYIEAVPYFNQTGCAYAESISSSRSVSNDML